MIFNFSHAIFATADSIGRHHSSISSSGNAIQGMCSSKPNPAQCAIGSIHRLLDFYHILSCNPAHKSSCRQKKISNKVISDHNSQSRILYAFEKNQGSKLVLLIKSELLKNMCP